MENPLIISKYINTHYQSGFMPEGYCVKCRAKRQMKNATAIKMKNGRPATKGECPTCGTKMFRIGKA